MTKLNPLEEVLFQTWARAQGIDNYDHPKNYFDHRGLYKQSNGMVQPIGVISSMTQAHNQGIEAQNKGGEGGDMTVPDPYMAQAEMHGNMLKFHGDQQKDQAKMQMEERKLQHQSEEKEKDRQHKLQLEQMKMQQKAQADEMNRQARAQEAEAMRQSRAQEAQAMRDHGMQESVMQEQFARSRPQPEPQATSGMGGGQPQPQPGSVMGGLMNGGM